MAYALVEADTSDTSELVAAVTDIEGVKGAHVVAGDVDLIAQVEVPNPGSVSQIIAGEIAAIDAVGDTETYMSMDG